MRFTLLSASAALAASLILSACSGGTSSSPTIPGGSTISTPMSLHRHHGGYHLVMIGNNKHTLTGCQTSGGATYANCFALDPGTTTAVGSWCLSTSGNCTSGVLPGKAKWINSVDGCGVQQTAYLAKTPPTCVGRVKTIWGPPRTVVGVITENVVLSADVQSTNGYVGYDASFEACITTGSYAGTCATNQVGIIVN